MVGGSRYHTGSPSVKSYRLQVSKVALLMIPDDRERKGKRKRKRKRIMLIGNEPTVSLVTEVVAVVGETTEETGLMNRW